MSAREVVILNSEKWMESAVCASSDPEEWFPEKGVSARRAKNICATCPVIDDCLQFALKNGETGIWGGTSSRERRRLMRAAS
jgi:WhiB family redox-sensing transcriptional regulator